MDTTDTTGMRKVLGAVMGWFRGEPHEDAPEGPDDLRYQFDDVFGDEQVRDDDIEDTINLIHATEKRWASDDLPIDYKPVSTGDPTLDEMAERVETNNDRLTAMIDAFDKATFKADYKQLKQSNDKLAKKYAKLRTDYKKEIEDSRELHKRYAELVKKYVQLQNSKDLDDLKDKLREKEARLAEYERRQQVRSQENKDMGNRYDRLLQDSVRSTNNMEQELAKYKQLYDDVMSRRQASTTAQPSDDTMTTIEVLRRKYRDKKLSDLDTQISAPVIARR